MANVGDIIRFTRFGGRLKFGGDHAWAVVNEIVEAEENPGLTVYGYVDFIPDVGQQQAPGDLYEEHNWQWDHNDTYEIVPEDQVPDEVWAALVKWRLTCG